jgi:hypothetical protein
MTQTEITTSIWDTEAANDGIFSTTIQKHALSILEKNHGWLVAAMWGPVRDLIEWATNRHPNLERASSVIDARRRFNQAAIQAANNRETVNWHTEPEKKAA